jgi:hypothetical protein
MKSVAIFDSCPVIGILSILAILPFVTTILILLNALDASSTSICNLAARLARFTVVILRISEAWVAQFDILWEEMVLPSESYGLW